MSAKTLPKDITSYDLLKFFAVIIMVIDHIGTYFYPDILWWKAVGRIGFPVWFFLVGHSSGRDWPPRLVGGALILVAANFVVGKAIFPLNALVTIMLIRVMIDPVMKLALQNKYSIYLWSFFLLLLIIPTYSFTEYGTQALITAMFGYMIRHRETINNERLVFGFMVFALVSFVLAQQLNYGFSQEEFLFMALGTMCVRMYLYYFEARTYPHLTKILPAAATWLVQLGGRRTLEIYVVHLILFKLAALSIMHNPDYAWFDLKWVNL